MVVAVIRLELSLPGVTSLKEKRRILTSVMERARGRYGVSVAEVEGQDLWQRAVVGMALVSGDSHLARKAADKVVGFVERHLVGEGEVCRAEVEIW